MRIDVLTLFPEIFSGFRSESILKRAIDRGVIEFYVWNFRDWSTDKHRKVDDRPYGGGPGMVIRPEPVFAAVEAVQRLAEPPGKLILLSPRGRRFSQQWAAELAREPRLILLCGRYEGFDERIRLGLKPEELSIGDYVTCGGEVPAMVVIETLVRLVPGALGDVDSPREESFSDWGLLEYPQYTRPREYRGMRVPEVLLSGDHAAIEWWRLQQALRITQERRPDLLEAIQREGKLRAVQERLKWIAGQLRVRKGKKLARQLLGDQGSGSLDRGVARPTVQQPAVTERGPRPNSPEFPEAD
jgi:tRNA (guanine37-N1)-methyltransferase